VERRTGRAYHGHECGGERLWGGPLRPGNRPVGRSAVATASPGEREADYSRKSMGFPQTDEGVGSFSAPTTAVRAQRPNPFVRLVLAASGLVALGLWALARTLPTPDLHLPALQVVPPGSTLLVVARPAPLRARGLWRLPKGSEPAKLLADVTGACKINLLDEVDEVALATPGSARDGTFGAVFSGTFLAAPRVACVERLARDRGRLATRTRAGANKRFVVLTDETSGASFAATNGLLLVGSAAYVGEMIRTADGSVEGGAVSAATEPLHRGLQRELADGALVVASLRLTADTREAIRREVGDPTAPASQIVGLVGSVRPAPTSPSGDSRAGALGLKGLVACEDEVSAKALTEVVERLARDAEGTVTARFLGLSPLLHDRIVTTEGRGAVLRTEASPETLGALLDAAEKVWSP
jgi:hypothetical protein